MYGINVYLVRAIDWLSIKQLDLTAKVESKETSREITCEGRTRIFGPDTAAAGPGPIK